MSMFRSRATWLFTSANHGSPSPLGRISRPRSTLRFLTAAPDAVHVWLFHVISVSHVAMRRVTSGEAISQPISIRYTGVVVFWLTAAEMMADTVLVIASPDHH